MPLAIIRRYLSRRVRVSRAEDAALNALLDVWTIEPPPSDLAERVVARAARLPQRAGFAELPRDIEFWPAAAAFALAVVLGYFAALSSLRAGNADGVTEWASIADMVESSEDGGEL